MCRAPAAYSAGLAAAGTAYSRVAEVFSTIRGLAVNTGIVTGECMAELAMSASATVAVLAVIAGSTASIRGGGSGVSIGSMMGM